MLPLTRTYALAAIALFAFDVPTHRGLRIGGSRTLAVARTQSPDSLVPNEKNLDEWLEFIRPDEAERAWEDIGWRSQFWPAVTEARQLGRPILLWTMNGHPLGCT